MPDPLSEVISLLRPTAPSSKIAHASGPLSGATRRYERGVLLPDAVREGLPGGWRQGAHRGWLRGDFVLIPAAAAFAFSSLDPPPQPGLTSRPVLCEDGIFRIGPPDGAGRRAAAGRPLQLLGSRCRASGVAAARHGCRGAAMTALPPWPGWCATKARANRPARDVVVEHLLQVLLIEAFRSTTLSDATPGLCRGLADLRIGPALRAMHAAPDRTWTLPSLAGEAGLSRSAFFTRFSRVVGRGAHGLPVELADDAGPNTCLRAGHGSIADISEKDRAMARSAPSAPPSPARSAFRPVRYARGAAAG